MTELPEVERLAMVQHDYEATCSICGGPNFGSWAAPSPLWNAVMRREGAPANEGEIVCPPCFVKEAETLFGPLHWQIAPSAFRDLPLEFERGEEMWDDERWLWAARDRGHR